jgi:hypothetical protein
VFISSRLQEPAATGKRLFAASVEVTMGIIRLPGMILDSADNLYGNYRAQE